MYCIKCGVELEEHLSNCPLCGIHLCKPKEEITGEYPEIKINLYEIKIRKIKKSIFLSFLTMGIISILEIFLQNIMIEGKLTWGYYAIPSVCLFLVSVFVLLNYYSFRQNLFLLFMANSAYFLFIDMHNKKIEWSLITAIPIVFSIYILGMIFTVIIKRHQQDKFKIVNYFLILVGIFLLILEFIIRYKLSWSLWASIPLFVLGIMLRYIYNTNKDEFKKRLHL